MEAIKNKGFYVPCCSSKSEEQKCNCCSKQLRETTSLFKMVSKIATETSKTLLIQYLKPVDINYTKFNAILFRHSLCAYTLAIVVYMAIDKDGVQNSRQSNTFQLPSPGFASYFTVTKSLTVTSNDCIIPKYLSNFDVYKSTSCR